MKSFGGPALFLDRSDINTDEIIPAKYLTEITKEDLKPYLLEDLKLPGFDPKSEKTTKAGVVITRANFGCGSSREHAPIALGAAGVEAVVAESFARIFFRNCVATGELYPFDSGLRLCDIVKTGDEATLDFDNDTLTVNGSTSQLKPLGDVRPVIDAGGLFNYARQSGMIAAAE